MAYNNGRINTFNQNASISNLFADQHASTFQPPANITYGSVSELHLNPTFIGGSGSISNAFALRIKTPTATGAVRNVYSLEVDQPTGGSILNVCADFKGVSYLESGLVFAAPGTNGTVMSTYIENGSFSPTVAGTTTAGTATYATRFGSYAKIGNMVFVEILLTWSAGTGTGNLEVSSLPFTVRNISANYQPVAQILLLNVTWSGGSTMMTAVFQPNTTNCLIQGVKNNAAAQNIVYAASGTINLSGWYIT